MALSVKLNKSIILDNPRDLVAYVTLSVVETTGGIDKNIFVVKYSPPASPQDKGERSFYNVAYVDQLEDVPLVPENKRKACFLRDFTVKKSFANSKVAEKWCTEIYQEIMRLLSTYAVGSGSTSKSASVIVTENGYVVTQLGTVVEEAHTLTQGSSESSVETVVEESSEEQDYEVIEVTYNGSQVIKR